MQHYELLFINPLQANEKEQTEVLEKVVGMATALGMKVIAKQEVGKRRLAYPIKKATAGFYWLVEFEGEQNQIKKLNRELQLSPAVFRHLLIKKVIRAKVIRKERVIPKKVETIEAKPVTEEKKGEPVKKIKLEDLDKKLDEILKEDV